MLFARLQRKHERATALGVLRKAHDAARQAAQVLFARGNEAQRGAAVIHAAPQRLPVAHHIVRAQLGWGFQQRLRNGVHDHDGQCARRVRLLDDGPRIHNPAQIVGLLDYDCGGVGADFAFIQVRAGLAIGLRHVAIARVDLAVQAYAVPLGLLPGDAQRLTQRAARVVQTGIGGIHAG